MRPVARALTGLGAAMLLAGAGFAIPTTPILEYETPLDVRVDSFSAWAVDQATVAFEVWIEVVGVPETAAGEVGARWDGDEVGRWPLDLPEGAGDSFLYEQTAAIPQEWAGREGWFEVAVFVEGDTDLENNTVGQSIDLPDPPRSVVEPPPRVPETGGGDGDGDGDEFDPTWVFAGGAAAAVLGAAALARRGRWRQLRQAEATDAPAEGPCGPGTVRTTRSCRPKPKLRKVTGLSLAAADRAGRRRPIESDLAKSKARKALAAALRHRRAGHDRRFVRKLDAAAMGLVEEIHAALPRDGSTWDVDLTGAYRGGRMKCTFRHWKCSRKGTWPRKPAKEWTAKVTDRSSLAIGRVTVSAASTHANLVAEIRPKLARFVDRVCETRRPVPAGIAVEIEV